MNGFRAFLFSLLLLPLAARAQPGERLCFVQFIHPGLEHEPDSAAGRSWNVEMHRRKFLRQPGRCLAAPDAKPVAAPLVFWGEYEPPTRLVKTFANPVPDGPRFLFAPAPVEFHPHDPPLMNTDPFVFGDRFFYSICKQNNKRGPTAMQRLARGSVILFGSGKNGWMGNSVEENGKGMTPLFELVLKGYSKAAGMQRILDHLGAAPEQTYAIGDSTNDLPMFSVAAHTACLGDGMEELKAVSEYVTAPVLEDGIQKALEHFGLLR